MATMRFRSNFGARQGFTLLEILIAMAIGGVVLGLVANAYLGANKAQSITVASGLMKASGQMALNQIYEGLHQSHTIFGRNDGADSYMSRLPIFGFDTGAGALRPGVVQTELVLPVVQEKAAFYDENATGAPNADFDPASVGNTLLFATSEPKAILHAEFGQPEAHLSAHRLHFYYPARREMPPGAYPVRPGDSYTYQLMHWKSQLYLDYNDVVEWIRRYKDNGATDAEVATKLDRLRMPSGPYAGAINLEAGDGSLAATPGVVFDLTTTGSPTDLDRNAANRFQTDQFRAALKLSMRDSFGETMVAFNTGDVPVRTLQVPAFADDGSDAPYGFEVAVGGSQENRQVLLRLAMAARTQPGNLMVGQTFQQVARIYAAENNPNAATPTPAPTPSGKGKGKGG